MWKRIIIYIIILIILLGLYLIFTPQSMKTPSKDNSSGSSSLNTPEKTPNFKGPTGVPSVKGPTEPPPGE